MKNTPQDKVVWDKNTNIKQKKIICECTENKNCVVCQ